MGLFDFLKPKGPPPTVAPAAPTAKQPYLGDLAKTAEIYQLVDTPPADRDEAWNAAFLANLSAASFRCGDPQVIQGPDGFPYVHLLLPEPGVGFQCYVIERMKDDFLLKRGLGVVIKADDSAPDWVLSYGDILNLHLNNEFYTTAETPFSKEVSDENIKTEEKVLVGQPAETLLPQVTRNVLREFLESNGVSSPKVSLMMRHQQNETEVSQDLAFNIIPQNFGSEEDFRTVMERLPWFLPRHYSIVGLREMALEDGFMPL